MTIKQTGGRGVGGVNRVVLADQRSLAHYKGAFGGGKGASPGGFVSRLSMKFAAAC